MYTDQIVSLVFLLWYKLQSIHKTVFFHRPLPKRPIFLYECKKLLCNYMKHCYQNILLQNKLSLQRRLAQRERVIKKNQLWKLIKYIYNAKMYWYCVYLYSFIKKKIVFCSQLCLTLMQPPLTWHCTQNKNEHPNICKINNQSLQDNVALWIQCALPYLRQHILHIFL